MSNSEPANAAADTLDNREPRNARRAVQATDSDRPMRRVPLLPRKAF